MFHKKADNQLIKNLDNNKATKKIFKRQPKLDRQKTYSEIQESKAKRFLWVYILTVCFIIVAAVLYKYYMAPYWEHYYQVNIKNQHIDIHSPKAIWAQITAFFQIHHNLGATFDIVFIVFSVIGVSTVITSSLYWLLRSIGNIFKFGRNWLFWLIISCFIWLPIINFFVLMFVIHKYHWYQKVAIANQTELATQNTISKLNTEVK